MEVCIKTSMSDDWLCIIN